MLQYYIHYSPIRIYAHQLSEWTHSYYTLYLTLRKSCLFVRVLLLSAHVVVELVCDNVLLSLFSLLLEEVRYS